MWKVQTLNKIDEKGLEQLPNDTYSVGDTEDSPHAIVVRSQKVETDKLLNNNLLAIARAGVGVNNIPIEECTRRGIVVFNTPGANANGVKELTIVSLLLASRDIAMGIKWVQKMAGKEGKDVAATVEKEKEHFVGSEIQGKTLGVIGLGGVGGLVANAAVSLGMHVRGFDPFLSVDQAWRLSRDVQQEYNLQDLFAGADYISLHVPLTPETKHLINAKTLAGMKDGVRLINLSRGELVHNADLIEATKTKKVARYVTDFPTEELLGNRRIITIPHLGASTEESEENCAVMAARQIKDFLEYGNIKNSVNFPDTRMEKPREGFRLAVCNENIPGMVQKISTIIAERKLNILDMLNKNRGQVAYTLVDIGASNLKDSLTKALEQEEGILKARRI